MGYNQQTYKKQRENDMHLSIITSDASPSVCSFHLPYLEVYDVLMEMSMHCNYYLAFTNEEIRGCIVHSDGVYADSLKYAIGT